MEVLMSNWCTKTAQSLPEKYVFPPGKRPGKHVFPVCENVPVIDLEKAKIQQILDARQEFGFFQVLRQTFASMIVILFNYLISVFGVLNLHLLSKKKLMEVLMSNWCTKTAQSLPEKYVFPPGKRPGKHVFPVCENVPVIDLEKAKIQQILDACQEFGFFQVINHGIPVTLMDETMRVFQEFFGTSPEYKSSFYSTDMKRKCRIYSSSMDYDKEEVHYWRDNFTHHCYPIEDYIELWPENPTRYREIVGRYSVEGRKFLLRILDLIGEGLGLKPRYFDGELSKTQLLSINHHIPCPNPSLTLGMPEHRDPNLISMLQQCSVPGLQVFFQGQWMNIEPVENAFFVIPGMQLKVITNGKFSSPIHRVMTNSEQARTTIGTFLIPSMDMVIKPVEDCAGNSPIYRGFTYKEFFSAYTENKCDWEITLESFKIKNN